VQVISDTLVYITLFLDYIQRLQYSKEEYFAHEII
jgi:hypothetical protein